MSLAFFSSWAFQWHVSLDLGFVDVCVAELCWICAVFFSNEIFRGKHIKLDKHAFFCAWLECVAMIHKGLHVFYCWLFVCICTYYAKGFEQTEKQIQQCQTCLTMKPYEPTGRCYSIGGPSRIGILLLLLFHERGSQEIIFSSCLTESRFQFFCVCGILSPAESWGIFGGRCKKSTETLKCCYFSWNACFANLFKCLHIFVNIELHLVHIC